VVVGACDRRLMGTVVIDRDADRPSAVRVGVVGSEGDTELLPDMHLVEIGERGKAGDDLAGIVAGYPVLLEKGAEALALGDSDDLLVARRASAGVALRDVGNVLRDDAHAERRERIRAGRLIDERWIVARA